jgi:hypothetical protein
MILIKYKNYSNNEMYLIWLKLIMLNNLVKQV